MSISELLVPNNLTLYSKALISNSVSNPATSITPIVLNVGAMTTPLYQKSSGNAVTTPAAPSYNVLTLNFQIGQNSTTYINFLANGIVTGGANNNQTPYQRAEWAVVWASNTIAFNGGNPRLNDQLITPTWPGGTCGIREVTNLPNQVVFQAYNTNALQTTHWIWSIEIWSVNQ